LKLVTKNSDYAIRALVVLAQNKGNFVSAREIAQQQGIPYQFLRRILQQLIRNKLVVSREGGRGGFKLKAKPKDVSIVEVMKIFQGKIQLSECMFRKKICANRSSCILRKEVRRVEDIVKRELKGVTLAKLLKKRK